MSDPVVPGTLIQVHGTYSGFHGELFPLQHTRPMFFPLQESGICHAFLLTHLSNRHSENKMLKYKMLEFGRYGIFETWKLLFMIVWEM